MTNDEQDALKPGDPLVYSKPDERNGSAFRFRILHAVFVKHGSNRRRIQIEVDGRTTWVSTKRVDSPSIMQVFLPSKRILPGPCPIENVASLPTAVDFAFALGRDTVQEPWSARDLARMIVECGPMWLHPVALQISASTPREVALRLTKAALRAGPQ
jgi:hypothetical protein